MSSFVILEGLDLIVIHNELRSNPVSTFYIARNAKSGIRFITMLILFVKGERKNLNWFCQSCVIIKYHFENSVNSINKQTKINEHIAFNEETTNLKYERCVHNIERAH